VAPVSAMAYVSPSGVMFMQGSSRRDRLYRQVADAPAVLGRHLLELTQSPQIDRRSGKPNAAF
jgi:hypothetical protein